VRRGGVTQLGGVGEDDEVGSEDIEEDVCGVDVEVDRDVRGQDGRPTVVVVGEGGDEWPHRDETRGVGEAVSSLTDDREDIFGAILLRVGDCDGIGLHEQTLAEVREIGKEMRGT
jgi:hypothetical protein